MSYYKNPYMFRHRGAIIRGRSIQRNVAPTHQSSYYVAFIEVIRILNTKILKYIKLIKVKVSLEQAMKAQRGSRGIAVLFL